MNIAIAAVAIPNPNIVACSIVTLFLFPYPKSLIVYSNKLPSFAGAIPALHYLFICLVIHTLVTIAPAIHRGVSHPSKQYTHENQPAIHTSQLNGLYLNLTIPSGYDHTQARQALSNIGIII
jgi:hypothetical protein